MSNYCIYWKNQDSAMAFKHGEQVYYLVFDLSGIQKYIFQSHLEQDPTIIQQRSQAVDSILEQMHRVFEKEYGNSYLNVNYFGGNLECIFKKDIDLNKLDALLEKMVRSCLTITKQKLGPIFAYEKCQFFYSDQKLPFLLRRKNWISVRTLLIKALEMKKYHKKLYEEDENPIFFLPKQAASIKLNTISHGVSIKCDLDNLGAFFQSIKEVDQRKDISLILQNSMKEVAYSLDAQVILCGGDDLFVIANYHKAYEIANQIHNDLQRILEERLKEYQEFNFSLSLGISAYHAPISFMYLSEIGENQLESAKKDGKNCVYFDGTKLSWEEVASIHSYLQKMPLKSVKKLKIISRESFLSDLKDMMKK